MGTATVGLVPQQGLQVTRGCEPSQSVSQQVGLSGYRRIVEIQIDDVIGKRTVVDVVASRQGGFPNEGAAAGFAADEAHGGELGVDPGRGDQGQPFSGGKLAMSRQPRAWRDLACADIGRQRVYDVFVSSADHAAIVCMTII